MGRRRVGTLLDLEVGILAACFEAGEGGAHGFAIAKVLADHGDGRQLTATGTLYRALHRLETGGMVHSHWEDPDDAETQGRPRRRLYRLTATGVSALSAARADSQRSVSGSVVPGWST
jgi:DNA-binding PadR family transcriptional regulator